MEVDKHFGGIRHMVRRRQFSDMLLGDLEDLILQWQIKRRGDEQPGAREIGRLDVQRRCQFIDGIADEVRSRIIGKDTTMQKMWLLYLVNGFALLDWSDVAL